MTFKDRSRDYRNDLSFSKRVPDGDAISRNICDHCGLINYENPKIVAGVVAVWQDRILMCRRAIEPRLGSGPCPQVSWKTMKPSPKACPRSPRRGMRRG